MMVGGRPDKYGYYWDAGYEWCASVSKCIQPFEESCPIEGPVLDIIGPQTMVIVTLTTTMIITETESVYFVQMNVNFYCHR